jgi:DNA mismatch endonuclease, patch repair protein
MGLRYRVDYPVRDDQPRPARPDIAFLGLRLAVFIDGCYWHGCPEHGRRDGGKNRAYWGPKIARNRERDEVQVHRLHAAGWIAMRFWEHEPLSDVVFSIVRALATRTEELGLPQAAALRGDEQSTPMSARAIARPTARATGGGRALPT